MQLDECPENGARQSLVHREALARPVGRSAQAAKLLDDCAARLVLPFPDRLDEFFASHRDAALLTFGELSLDDQLRSDSRMIGSDLPEHVLSPHALEAREDVLQS